MWGIGDGERQIYYRAGISSEEPSGREWKCVSLPHVSLPGLKASISEPRLQSGDTDVCVKPENTVTVNQQTAGAQQLPMPHNVRYSVPDLDRIANGIGAMGQTCTKCFPKLCSCDVKSHEAVTKQILCHNCGRGIIASGADDFKAKQHFLDQKNPAPNMEPCLCKHCYDIINSVVSPDEARTHDSRVNMTQRSHPTEPSSSAPESFNTPWIHQAATDPDLMSPLEQSTSLCKTTIGLEDYSISFSKTSSKVRFALQVSADPEIYYPETSNNCSPVRVARPVSLPEGLDRDPHVLDSGSTATTQSTNVRDSVSESLADSDSDYDFRKWEAGSGEIDTEPDLDFVYWLWMSVSECHIQSEADIKHWFIRSKSK